MLLVLPSRAGAELCSHRMGGLQAGLSWIAASSHVYLIPSYFTFPVFHLLSASSISYTSLCLSSSYHEKATISPSVHRRFQFVYTLSRWWLPSLKTRFECNNLLHLS